MALRLHVIAATYNNKFNIIRIKLYGSRAKRPSGLLLILVAT